MDHTAPLLLLTDKDVMEHMHKNWALLYDLYPLIDGWHFGIARNPIASPRREKEHALYHLTPGPDAAGIVGFASPDVGLHSEEAMRIVKADPTALNFLMALFGYKSDPMPEANIYWTSIHDGFSHCDETDVIMEIATGGMLHQGSAHIVGQLIETMQGHARRILPGHGISRQDVQNDPGYYYMALTLDANGFSDSGVSIPGWLSYSGVMLSVLAYLGLRETIERDQKEQA